MMSPTEKKLDLVWARFIKSMYPYCVICGSSEYIQAAHIIPRARGKYLRWDTRNGITLCMNCHYDFDKMMTNEERQHLVDTICGTGRWSWLNVNSHFIKKWTDNEMKAKINYLRRLV
jgi:hypothetical protein